MNRHKTTLAVLLLLSAGCDDATAESGSAGASTSGEATSSSDPTPGASSDGSSAGTSSAATSTGRSSSNATANSETGGEGSTTADTPGDDGSSGDSTGGPPSDNHWILEHFAKDPVMTGDFDSRTVVEMPQLVHNATGTNAKYAFTPLNQEGPEDKRVAFMNVHITDLVSSDAYGGGIATNNADPGVSMYLSNVYIEPNWPEWQDYESTNYDGIVLDGSLEFYAEDLTIVNWNADSAIDIKSQVAQLSRFHSEGGGNRTLRFWREGPHYIVESTVDNPTGGILWFRYCDTTTLYVYDSTFNGEAQVPPSRVQCDEGSSPTIIYLDEDPRASGEMHPMFAP